MPSPEQRLDAPADTPWRAMVAHELSETAQTSVHAAKESSLMHVISRLFAPVPSCTTYSDRDASDRGETASLASQAQRQRVASSPLSVPQPTAAAARRDAVWGRVLESRHAEPWADAQTLDMEPALHSPSARTEVRLARWCENVMNPAASLAAQSFLLGGFLGGPVGALAGTAVGLGLGAGNAVMGASEGALQGLQQLARQPHTLTAKAELCPQRGSDLTGLFATGAPCLISVVAGRHGVSLRLDAFTDGGDGPTWRGGDNSDADFAKWAKVRRDGSGVLDARVPCHVCVTVRDAGDDGRSAPSDPREPAVIGAWKVYAEERGQARKVGVVRLASDWVPSAYGDAHLA